LFTASTDAGSERGTVPLNMASVLMISGSPALVLICVILGFMVTKTLLKRHRRHAGNCRI